MSGELRRRAGHRDYVARERARRVDLATKAVQDFAPPARAATMREVFAAYLADLEAAKKPSLIDVKSAVECWLDPALGDLAPAACTPLRVAALVRAMTSAGCAANTVRTKCGFVRAALGCAVKLELVERHPCPSLRGILPPKRTRADFSAAAEVLAPAELARVVSSPRVPWVSAMVYLVAGTTGARVGEVIALRRSDVDFRAPYAAALHIRQQYSRKTKSFRLPKGGGPRVAALVPVVADWLRAWIDEGYRALTGRACGPEDLLFPQVIDGELRPRNDRRVLKYWKKHLGRVGLPARREHALRHTAVALLLDAGIDDGIVESFTHAPPCATPFDMYRHWSWKVRAEAVLSVKFHLQPRTGQLELFPGPEEE